MDEERRPPPDPLEPPGPGWPAARGPAPAPGGPNPGGPGAWLAGPGVEEDDPGGVVDVRDQADALSAFARFTELAGREINLHVLAARALEVIRQTVGEGSTAWYRRAGNLWRAQAWFGDLDEGTIAEIRAGVSVDAPTFELPARTLQPVFWDAWRGREEGLGEWTEQYGPVCVMPIVVDGRLNSMFAVGLKSRYRWTERDKAIIRAVGRSLTLAVERAQAARRLAGQARELEAQNRALEGFAVLSRDLGLESDPLELVGRAQEIVLGLLPPGVALYYELRDGRWRCSRQTGPLPSERLQAAVDAGLPYAEAGNLSRPFETRQPYYQARYDRDTDNLRDHVEDIAATATVPVIVGDEVCGVFAVALFHAREWTRADRAMLETATRSLALAMERARATRALREQNRLLEERNADQETFVYTVSHDLRAPLLSLHGMSDVLDESLVERDEAMARFALARVRANVDKMNQLLNDLLQLSRAGRVAEDPASVNLLEAVRAAAADLDARLAARGGRLEMPESWPDVHY
ncbi:MAG TPA: GAF domain-containing protein, partial [Deinococcales bacterium]|nr:GAF domain-containing protein [Deinococcales bacterium]